MSRNRLHRLDRQGCGAERPTRRTGRTHHGNALSLSFDDGRPLTDTSSGVQPAPSLPPATGPDVPPVPVRTAPPLQPTVPTTGAPPPTPTAVPAPAVPSAAVPSPPPPAASPVSPPAPTGAPASDDGELERRAERLERGDDAVFQKDLVDILGAHRPDPANPPPPEPAPAAPAPATGDGAPGPPTAGDGADQRSMATSHEIFDRLGEHLSHATTYDVGPVALQHRLDQFDRVIEEEESAAAARSSRLQTAQALRADDDVTDVADITGDAPTAPAAATPPAADVAPAVPDVRRVTHAVEPVAAGPGLSCWGAAAAVLVGWRDSVRATPRSVASGEDPWEAYGSARTAQTLDAMRPWGLTYTNVSEPEVLFDLLDAHGPLWVAADPPGEHAVVVSGGTGASSPDEHRFDVTDPCRADPADDPGAMSWPELRARLGDATTGVITGHLPSDPT